MRGRGSFPQEPQTKQLGGKAGVKAQQTDSCPRAERGRRQTQAWEQGRGCQGQRGRAPAPRASSGPAPLETRLSQPSPAPRVLLFHRATLSLKR